MSTDPTKDQIADWLEKTGRDRHWLAEQCGASKATIDGWFSTRGFPKPAIQIIKRLMGTSGSPTSEVSAVSFTIAEFEMIDSARIRAGYSSRTDFYRDAIIEMAANLKKDQETRDPLSSLPLVAEEILPYQPKTAAPFLTDAGDASPGNAPRRGNGTDGA